MQVVSGAAEAQASDTHNGTLFVPICILYCSRHPDRAYLPQSVMDSKRADLGPVMHTEIHAQAATLSALVDSYQATGRYVLLRDQALEALGISDEALKKAVQRLVAKRRLAVPRRGFFIIVPMEYRAAGAPPPAWFIDDLMKFCEQPYYVGLLSAAALHGAAHHQPQEFQVVTNKQQRPAVAGRARLRFFRKRHIERVPTMEMKTETGAMRVSTPEATALDLLRYIEGAGHLGNVATVLAELAEKMDGQRLVEVAKLDGELANAQRLGHILDQVGAGELGAALAAWVASLHPRFVPLRSDRSARRAAKDARWHVLVNERVEAET